MSDKSFRASFITEGNHIFVGFETKARPKLLRYWYCKVGMVRKNSIVYKYPCDSKNGIVMKSGEAQFYRIQQPSQCFFECFAEESPELFKAYEFEHKFIKKTERSYHAHTELLKRKNIKIRLVKSYKHEKHRSCKIVKKNDNLKVYDIPISNKRNKEDRLSNEFCGIRSRIELSNIRRAQREYKLVLQ